MTTELHEARSAHAMALANHQSAQHTYSDLYNQLQAARTDHDSVAELKLQGELVKANEHATLMKQILGGHVARLRAIERDALTKIKRQQATAYAVMAHQLADKLALLMVIDQKLGLPNFDCLGIGRFHVPAAAHLKGDDSGALVSFYNLSGLMGAAGKELDTMLVTLAQMQEA